MKPTVLIIACGALAHELVDLQRRNQWQHIRIQCLPARLHNDPDQITGAVREAVLDHLDDFDEVFVAYGDCGTGGKLDAVLKELGVKRLPGTHCYDFLSGKKQFAGLAEEEPGTFYLTDFLTRHFDRLVRQGLGLDRHPQLLGQYFGNYRRVVLLSQSESPELTAMARAHADYLGLEFVEHRTGLRPLKMALKQGISSWPS